MAKGPYLKNIVRLQFGKHAGERCTHCSLVNKWTKKACDPSGLLQQADKLMACSTADERDKMVTHVEHITIGQDVELQYTRAKLPGVYRVPVINIDFNARDTQVCNRPSTT